MGKNKTIYFRTGIYEKLPPDAGPLINDLLEAHFNKSTPRPKMNPLEERALAGAVKDELNVIPPKPTGISGAQYNSYEKKVPTVDASSEKPCCANKSNRCQHWDWDGDQVEWVNSLSNRRVAA